MGPPATRSDTRTVVARFQKSWRVSYATVPPAEPFPHNLGKVCGVVLREPELGGGRKGGGAAAHSPEPLLHGVQAHPIMQSAFDELCLKGDHWYWHANFATGIPDEAVAAQPSSAQRCPVVASRGELERGVRGRGPWPGARRQGSGERWTT